MSFLNFITIFAVKDKTTNQVLPEGVVDGGLYKFQLTKQNPSAITTSSTSNPTQPMFSFSTSVSNKDSWKDASTNTYSVWPQRLGHLSSKVLIIFFNLVISLYLLLKYLIHFAMLVNLENHISYLSSILSHSIQKPLNLLYQIYGDHHQQCPPMVFDIMSRLWMSLQGLHGFTS